jgi:hypothetical protein
MVIDWIFENCYNIPHVIITEAMTDALATQLAYFMWAEIKALNVLRIKTHSILL